VGLLLGLSSIIVPWDTLFISVLLYIVIPVFIAEILRRKLLQQGLEALEQTTRLMGPWSILSLLATLILLFAFQGRVILEQPLINAAK
ncbi:MAG: arsenical-resistance protein, partial [Betaproteobacteria bacterium]|nr:arsenical-resistance protein [Betaproteobacteria bacterium]